DRAVGGACAGTTACTVTMPAARAVPATFTTTFGGTFTDDPLILRVTRKAQTRRCHTENAMEREVLVQGLLWFAAFLFSTTVHEAAHTLAALRGGDPTAYLGGQVSLSPLPHIRREPIG